MKFRVLAAMSALAAGVACADGLDGHLKLYASFDQGVVPEIAQDGFRLAADVSPARTAGRFGGAVRFDKATKTGDLVYRTDGGFGTDGWTLCLWVNMDEGHATHYGQKTFSRGVFSTNGNNPSAGGASACLTCWCEFLMQQGPASLEQSMRTVFSSKALQPRHWTHLAFVFRPDGSNDIFLNGNPASYSEHNAAVSLSAVEALRIGSAAGNGDQLDGALDELQVYDKALSPEEVEEAMLSLPLRKTADIDLYVPFDGEIFGRGLSSFSAVNLVFAEGHSADGVKMMRHGYDRRAILSLSGLKTGRMAQSFFAWFVPDWKPGETAGARHGLWAACGTEFFAELEKNGEGLVWSVTSGERTSRVILKDIPWKIGAPHKVAAGYDFGCCEMFVSVDGRCATGRLDVPPPKGLSAGSLIVGDVRGADYYSKTQAEGTLDELLVVNGYFDGEILAEVVETEIAKKEPKKSIVVENEPVNGQEAELWDLASAERRRTSVRETISLNALWRCQLVDAQHPFDTNRWSYLAVPGRYSGAENGASECEFRFRDRDFKVVKDAKYEGCETFRFVESWFERGFRADPSWKGRRLRLVMDELSPSESGEIWLNGRSLGSIPVGAMDLAFDLPEHLVRFGGWNYLTLHAVDSGQRWNWRGVSGDVALEMLGAIRGEAPEIVTSVEKGTLSVSLRVASSASRETVVTVEATVTGAEKPLVVTMRPQVVHPGEKVTMSATVPFETEKLWDIDAPNLLTCVFRVKGENGETLDELSPIDFGVREFAIKGKDFYLNKKKIHLFIADEWVNPTADLEVARKTARMFKRLGYNTVRMGFGGAERSQANIFRACDEVGILYLPNAGGVAGGEYARWNDPKVRSSLTERMRARIEAWRNHASAVMWYLSINFLGYVWDYHPLKISDGYTDPSNADKARVCMEGVKILRQFDAAARPYFFQAGGNFGEVQTSNAYFCWWPQTEREAWAEEWAKSGEKPLVPIETSFPYAQSFYGMDLEHPGPKPLFYFENLARYYGPKVYESTDREMAAEIARSSLGRDAAVWYDAPSLQRLKGDLLVNTLERWRGCGMSGFCPFGEVGYAFGKTHPRHMRWTSKRVELPMRDHRRFGRTPDVWRSPYQLDANEDAPLPVAAALQRALAPVIAYFDGGDLEPADRQRNFAGGERLRKRLVVINDRRHAVAVRGDWSFADSRQTFERRLEPGERAVIPVEVTVPNVDRKERMTLNASVFGERPVDVAPVEITVWPRKKADDITPFGLYDSVGLTAAALDRLGVRYRRVLAAEDVRDGLTVVGAESLGDAFSALARRASLARRISDGRANVLVMAQKPDALTRLGLRTVPVYARTAYDARGREVGFWAGRGLLAPEKPFPDPKTEHAMPAQFFHWNNANIVCSYPILRPSEGQHEVLFSCGKDLVYAPVIDMACGRGSIAFCQFEIERRSQVDAEADALMLVLLRRFALWRPKEGPGPVELVGPGRAVEFGVVVSSTNVPGLAVTEAGRSAFPMFSSRDGYFRRPIALTVFSGEGVVPLFDPAVAAMKTVNGKRIVFYAPPESPCAKERACATKADEQDANSSSFAWAAQIVENRFRHIGQSLERYAGKTAENTLGIRLEEPMKKSESAAWPYGFSGSTYLTERHIRW